MLLFLEQVLNGLQLGFMLFLMAAGLTLVFGIMGLINLAHGSLYMVGAYGAAAVTGLSGSFLLGLAAALLSAGLCGLLLELVALRRLYDRDHLDQVLATFGLILFFNELTKILFGPQPLYLNVPDWLQGTVELIPGAPYPAYRLAVIGVGILVALGLFLLVNRSRLGMLIRAGASNREMVSALGVNIGLLYTLVFGLGAMLAGLAGALVGPLLSVEVGMGEGVLILTFVVIVIGGIGSIKGALVGALLVGLVDTLGRAFLPGLLEWSLSTEAASSLGASLASIAIYLLMALILVWRPQGLFPAQ
ncbi:branched-chain amino acid ABC transporter permease [Aestuariirhabdus litorea]|uniref:Branched-chain amino acid ABC transporter permease n=1 Tax=Aestuariirhabdus litorea TaxID=2528527 RepID=A0A3P3VTM4_9GAMM|nr:branched-chain amino acid ABC transporter permease [Aestuariirhabdus litorea]RRJ85318.1 branched-chain amino acid ABC transporter permease [Aestuariirhabdus litorea]RWW98540.1 branched-chain amino acid ABC transporter permease [Endozoicomonadaceae bacterium GTF-13]